MAWYMESLEDLEELYYRMKERNIPIERVSDHEYEESLFESRMRAKVLDAGHGVLPSQISVEFVAAQFVN